MQFPMTQSSFSSSNLLALDMMLKTLIASPEFNEMQDKNWNAITRLIPGTTARQCQRRYEELMKEAMAAPYSTPLSRPASSTAVSARPNTNDTQGKSSRPSSAKVKGSRSDKDAGNTKSGDPRPSSGDQGYYGRYSRNKPNPVMVIHVCDEAKNLKQDFHCPRDLLIREMKYFAEYLSTDAQRWEEVDISVHCDVQIFEWLMKYVKRLHKEMTHPPKLDGKPSTKLEPTNVISILISSDFLKMESLVQECIEFCQRNMTAIVSTPCNMNCINDKLAGRIADLFNHNEADDVKDRKDKFKSKLFAKKLEQLFDPNYSSKFSPENASTLYRCSVCKRTMTRSLQSRLKCLPSRMAVDPQGRLCYSHVRDAAWDVNEWLLELKNQLKTWRDVYWRVWGTVNWLSCSRCGEWFPCGEIGHCRYHPEQALYGDGTHNARGAIGEYQCCNMKVLRFDPTQPNTGCKLRDHVISVPSQAKDGDKTGGATEGTFDKKQVYDDLLAHRDAVSVQHQKLVSHGADDFEVDVFSREEAACGLKGDLMNPTASCSSLTDDSTKSDGRPKFRLQALTIEREVSNDDDFGFGESDDEMGDEEDARPLKTRKPRRSRVTVDPQAILLDAPDFSTTKQRKWDSSRSLRWNQDAQREEDQRRMKDIVTYLTKLRLGADRLERLKQKEYAGGIFSRLDSQWKATNLPIPKNSQPPFRYGQNKPRLTQLVSK